MYDDEPDPLENPEPFDELRVRRLSIVGPDGRERAAIGAGPNGTSLVLFDDRGRRRIVVGVNQDDIAPAVAAVALCDHHGRQRWAVFVEDNEPPCVVTYDADGRQIRCEVCPTIPAAESLPSEPPGRPGR